MTNILTARSTDEEASGILDELSRMQTWATLLMCRGVPGARDAADLIQRTRILIIERCKRPSVLAATAQRGGGAGDA